MRPDKLQFKFPGRDVWYSVLGGTRAMVERHRRAAARLPYPRDYSARLSSWDGENVAVITLDQWRFVVERLETLGEEVASILAAWVDDIVEDIENWDGQMFRDEGEG